MNRLPLGFSEWDIPQKNRIAHHFKPQNISETRSSTGEFLPPKIQPSITNAESDTVFRLRRKLWRAMNNIPMFVDEVRRLLVDNTRVWQSCDVTNISSHDGIDFLHLRDDGSLVVNLIRAGTKSQKVVHIEKNLVPVVWAKLNAWVCWAQEEWSDSWDAPSGDRDGNSFSFSRTLDIGFWKTIRWSGKYKNNGLRVEILEHGLEIV